MTNMWQEILQQPEVLEGCLKKNRAVIDDIVRDCEKKNIRFAVIAARGTSDHAAVYGKYALEILTGLPVALAAPSVMTMYGRDMAFGGSLVIGVSQSGEASDVIEVINTARRHGAVTAAVTNFPDSPLAEAAEFNLDCAAGLEKSVAATKTFTTELYLLGNLAASLAHDEKLTEEYLRVPDMLRETFRLNENIDKDVERYRFMKECFVLARGINYAIALEAALKIQETSYVRAKAYATSDFHHGPMAMVERDMPVIVYAPSGTSSSDIVEMVGRMKEAEGDVLMISDDAGLRALGSRALTVPKAMSDFTSPFCNAAVAQMFACRLSLLKGLNPDSPRMLHKITVTR
jgi:glucosamine--fructose-6-phosphate aminotransferase (isomerizing)